MRIDILTLFPNAFNGILNESIIKRAINDKKVEINLINFRNYSHLSNSQVDDTIYGGGPGMLLRCEPIFECIDDIRTDDSKIIILTPEGKTYNESYAKHFSKIKHLAGRTIAREGNPCQQESLGRAARKSPEKAAEKRRKSGGKAAGKAAEKAAK